MKTIPFTTTAPGPSMEPPCALTPLTVGNSRDVGKSQSIFPSSAENASRCPSTAPEKITPGIPVTAAGCDGLHPLGAPAGHGVGAAYQTLLPSAIRRAV